jgi:aminopeptidase N
MRKSLIINLFVAAVFFTFSFSGCTEREKKQIVVPGTSLALAEARKKNISDIHYALALDIPAAKSESINGEVTITFQLRNNTSPLQLDFNAPASNLQDIIVNKSKTIPTWENEHVIIDNGLLTDGLNVVQIKFVAGDAALNRNDDYLYALFVPARASTCFPVFDQPDLKATYHLEVRIPHEWEAMSNGRIIASENVGSKKHITFSETKPTSTYQFAFTAGKFHVASDEGSGMRMFYRETDSLKVAANLGKIFELHRQALAWLKDYTGIDYPYEKFEFALMPAFQFGGMEHPGNIYYRESSLFLEPTASVNDELRRAGLIAHETAHMWFGNLVTMKWFNDVWLKEVFANFMAGKIVNPSFPQVNHDLRFLMSHYPAAYDVDRTAGSHPIQQELDNLKNAGSVYGAIIYQKAPIMMRNLEQLMGENNFKEGLREYLNIYAYGNATWDDLIAVMKKHTPQDLEVWNRAWIKTKGMPEITYAIKDKKRLEVNVSRDSLHRIWPQFFAFYVSSNGVEATHMTYIGKDRPGIVPVPDTSNLNVIPNFRGTGYGYFLSDAKNIDFMLKRINTLSDPVARASVWINIWEYLLHGNADIQQVLAKLIDTIPREKNPLLLEYLTDKTGRIFWQFLTAGQRSLVSARLDEVVFRQLKSEKDISLQRVLFNCYRNIATTPGGIANLKQFWSDESAAGLKLSERDCIQLVFELAVREAEGHEDLLRKQMEKTTNPDRRAEMAFIAPALSQDPAVRDAFFESLKKKENRTHEPWVLDAQRYLQHPLRAESSAKYLKASLELLEEIQRTGDIFFPKGWLDATLGEYQSKKAADEVRAYLRANANLRNDLKNKLLQSSDMLFRAEAIVNATRVTPR